MRAPAASLARRHHRVRERFEALDIDALIVTHLPNILYLSNHDGTAGIVVLTREGVHLLVDARYSGAVAGLQASTGACPQLRVWDVPASYDEALLACVSEVGLARVGFESDHLTVSRHDGFRRMIGERALRVELRATSEVVERERIVKDAYEVDLMRQGAARLTAVAEAAFGAIRPGETERGVAGAIESAMRRAGFDRIAFDTIVASGIHSALPHHRAGDRRLERGDLVVLDFGGVLDGYCCDLTRTISVGPPGLEARKIYAAVRDAQQAAIDAVRAGIPAGAVDSAARNVLETHGLGQAFSHGTGHGLGLEVHELPRVSRPRPDTETPEVILLPGMVFTIEPGAYLPGWGGVRIEDDVLVTDDRCEVLTTITRELLAL